MGVSRPRACVFPARLAASLMLTLTAKATPTQNAKEISFPSDRLYWYPPFLFVFLERLEVVSMDYPSSSSPMNNSFHYQRHKITSARSPVYFK